MVPCKVVQQSQRSTANKVNHSMSFAELVMYIKDTRMDNLVGPIFMLTGTDPGVSV